MIIEHVVLLVGVGAVAGFIAGLVGIGGGVFWAPALLFYFDAIGVPDTHIAQLTIASSLFCSFVTSGSSAITRHIKGSVHWRIAIFTGLSSSVAILLMTIFVTTQPWYGRETFQILFSIVLVVVALRMIRGGSDHPDGSEEPIAPVAKLLGMGSAAGSLSSAVGVGGGVILVPMYERLIRLPIHLAMGTSSATIILITLIGVLSYAIQGEGGVGATDAVVGYVDFGAAAMLAVPAAFTAGYGVRLSHGINRTLLRRVFAVIVLIVAVRLIVGVLGA